MDQTLKYIGVVHSVLKNRKECPFQENENAPEATITIYPEFAEGIKDIQADSEIILLTWLHEADRSVIKCMRRKKYDSPVLGVFSTRSPDRPNPIGVHIVKVVSISEDWGIKVDGLDVLDQTPVIDIKPLKDKKKLKGV